MTFSIESFALSRDVRSAQRRPVNLSPMDFKEPPLMVLNNFTYAFIYSFPHLHTFRLLPSPTPHCKKETSDQTLEHHMLPKCRILTPFASCFWAYRFSNGPEHVTVMATVFENMFPKLDARKVVLSNVNRVILIDYDASSEIVSIRHYALRATPAGLSRPIRSMVVKQSYDNL